MIKQKKIILLIALLTFSISCKTDNKPTGFDYGKVENNTYSNSFFNFKMDLPTNWVVQSKEQTEALMEQGKDIIAGDNEEMKNLIDASEINTASLLALFQYETGSPVEYNPSLIIVAENLKIAPGIKTGSDYLFQAKKLLKQSQMEYDYIDNEFKKEIIDNQDFYTMNLALNFMGLNIKQKYYSLIQRGFCVSMIISYINDEQRDELEKTMKSIAFN